MEKKKIKKKIHIKLLTVIPMGKRAFLLYSWNFRTGIYYFVILNDCVFDFIIGSIYWTL